MIGAVSLLSRLMLLLMVVVVSPEQVPGSHGIVSEVVASEASFLGLINDGLVVDETGYGAGLR